MSPNASFSRPRRTLSALSFLTVLGASSSAFAAPPTPPAPAPGPAAAAEPAHAEAMADARFKAGLTAYDRGDYEGARLEFLQAQAIFPRASLFRNLALSELHTNRPLDALTHLRAYIADPATTPDRRALAERNLAEAFAQTGHLSITAPAGALVKVDGKDVGAAPLKESVDVMPGLHGVETDANGTTLRETVQAGAGKLTEVAFVSPVVGETRVVGLTPPSITPPLGGPAIQQPPPPAPYERPHYWNSRRTVGVVISGVGAVGMVLGGVFGSQRSGNTSDAATARGQVMGATPTSCFAPSPANQSACASLSSSLGSNGTNAQLEESLLIGGGVLFAVGLITTFWPGGGGEVPMPALAPTAGPHNAGLQWTGSF